MSRLKRWMMRLSLTGLAALAGCGFPWQWDRSNGGADDVVTPMYGSPPIQHDSTVRLTDFSYTPSGVIHVGDELVFSATLNHPPATAVEAIMQAVFGAYPTGGVSMADDGKAPDAQAADGIYTGSFVWTLAPVADTSVTAHLYWLDGAPGQTLDGPPLTVLPAEEGGI